MFVLIGIMPYYADFNAKGMEGLKKYKDYKWNFHFLVRTNRPP